MFGKFDQNQIRVPVTFGKPGEKVYNVPLAKMDNDINGTTRFVITKLTDGGKYLRGNDTLCYTINGVEIYTSSNNAIFVDLGNKTAWIRNDKSINDIDPKDPEDKEYILLYTDIGYEDCSEDDEFPLRWEAVVGRTSAYDNIKINAPVIDVDKSFVLVETVSFKDALTVRQFIDYLKNSNIIDDESFDINDFSGSDYI